MSHEWSGIDVNTPEEWAVLKTWYKLRTREVSLFGNRGDRSYSDDYKPRVRRVFLERATDVFLATAEIVGGLP